MKLKTLQSLLTQVGPARNLATPYELINDLAECVDDVERDFPDAGQKPGDVDLVHALRIGLEETMRAHQLVEAARREALAATAKREREAADKVAADKRREIDEHMAIDDHMTAIAQGVVNITEGVNVIERDSRVWRGMVAVVEAWVQGKLTTTVRALTQEELMQVQGFPPDNSQPGGSK